MAWVVHCECGDVARGATDDEVLDAVEAHLRAAHPELVGMISRQDEAGWIQIEPCRLTPGLRKGPGKVAEGFGQAPSATIALPSTAAFDSGASPLELVPVKADDRFPVNFYAGVYRQPKQYERPTSSAVTRVVAYDNAGRKVDECQPTPGPVERRCG